MVIINIDLGVLNNYCGIKQRELQVQSCAFYHLFILCGLCNQQSQRKGQVLPILV